MLPQWFDGNRKTASRFAATGAFHAPFTNLKNIIIGGFLSALESFKAVKDSRMSERINLQRAGWASSEKVMLTKFFRLTLQGCLLVEEVMSGEENDRCTKGTTN